MNDYTREFVKIETEKREFFVMRSIPRTPAPGKLSVLFCAGAGRRNSSQEVCSRVTDIALSRGVTLIHMQQTPANDDNSANDFFYEFAHDISIVVNCKTLFPQEGRYIIVGTDEGASIVSLLAHKLQKRRVPTVYALDPTLPVLHNDSIELREEYLRTLATGFSKLSSESSIAPHVYLSFSGHDHSTPIFQHILTPYHILKSPNRHPLRHKCQIAHGLKSLETAVHCMVQDATLRNN